MAGARLLPLTWLLLVLGACGHRTRRAPPARGPPRRALAPLVALSAVSALAPRVPRLRPRGTLRAMASDAREDGGGDMEALVFAAPPPLPSIEPFGEVLATVPTLSEHVWVMLPSDWVRNLDPESIRCDEAEAARAGLFFRCAARLLADPDFEVAFEAWQPGDPATARQSRLLELLRDTGVVPRAYEERRLPDSLFRLAESPGDRRLEDLIADWEAEPRADEALLMPLEISLPLVVDLLRGLVELEAVGVAHGDLSEHTIFVVDEDARTELSDLRSACEVGAGGDAAPGGLAGALHGSAFRHAPEMTDGLPNDTANNVWQLGLVFARLLLGGEAPTQLAVRRSGARWDDASEAGRREIRELVRERFSAPASPELRQLSGEFGDVVGIVVGMLRHDPERRLRPKRALQMAVDAARSRGIQLYPPRGFEELPLEWWGAFE